MPEQSQPDSSKNHGYNIKNSKLKKKTEFLVFVNQERKDIH